MESGLEVSKMASKVLSRFRDEGTLCDVQIQTGDKLFQAHKVILCSCSQYFCTLLTGAWSSPDRQLYSVPGVSADLMELVISFCYSHHAKLTEANVVDVLAAADMLMLPALLRLCYDFLEERLCEENCVGLWRLLGYYYCPEVESKIFRFILCNFDSVQMVSSELVDLSLDQLQKVLEDDELDVREESVAVEAALDWVRHCPEKRLIHLPQLLNKVRLGLISVQYLQTVVAEDELVQSSPECGSMVDSAITAAWERRERHLLNYSCPLTRPRLPSSVVFLTGALTHGPAPDGSSQGGLLAYDNRADAWREVPTESSYTDRTQHTCVALDRCVYLMGGRQQHLRLRSVVRFDVVHNAWQQVAPMNTRRCHFSAVTLDGYIYALGGYNHPADISSAERYHPLEDRWTYIAPMLRRRSRAGAAVLNGRVYVCGGYNGRSCMSLAERYSPELNQWTLINRMWSPRSGLRVAAYGGHIYAIGGVSSFGEPSLSSVEVYQPHTNSWANATPMSHARSDFGLALVEGRLLVVGGVDSSAVLKEAEYYDPEFQAWFGAGSMDTAVRGPSCCTVSGLHGHTARLFPRGPLRQEK